MIGCTAILVAFLRFRDYYYVWLFSNIVFIMFHGGIEIFKSCCLQFIYGSELAAQLQPVFHLTKPFGALLAFAFDLYIHESFGVNAIIVGFITTNIVIMTIAGGMVWRFK